MSTNKIPAISITTTLECNMACSYCMLTAKNEIQKFEHIKEDLERIIDFFNRSGESIAEIQFGGLEPLLQVEFIHEVMSFVPKEYIFKFTTNGTLPDKLKVLEKFYDRMILSISCDGTEEIQLAKRGKLVCEDFVAEAKKMNGFGFNFAIAPEYTDRMFESYLYLRDKSPTSLSFTIIYNSDLWTAENRKNFTVGMDKIFEYESTHKSLLGLANLFVYKAGVWERDNKDDKIHCDRMFALGIDKRISKCHLDYSFGGFATTSEELLNTTYNEQSEKMGICEASFCKTCKLNDLCTNKCPMSLLEKFKNTNYTGNNLDEKLNNEIRKLDKDINGVYMPCFVTSVFKGCLEKYGEILLWNEFALNGNRKLIEGFK